MRIRRLVFRSPIASALLAALVCVLSPACSPKQPNQTKQVDPLFGDPLFDDFASHWRQRFVSFDDRLVVPVVEVPVAEDPTLFVVGGIPCAYGNMESDTTPVVQLQWNEPADPIAVPDYRLDLTVGSPGFQGGFFSSAYPLAAGGRFLLPQNTSYLGDEPALLNIGPIFFPRIQSYTVVAIAPGLTKVTLTLDELGQGLEFELRWSQRQGNTWTETKRTAFGSDICLTGF